MAREREKESLIDRAGNESLRELSKIAAEDAPQTAI